MDRLRVVPPYGKSFLHPVERDSIVIGRSAAADLHIPDRFLSRRHARVYRDESNWWIEDLGSRNGSWLNGKRIDSPTPFANGDRLRLSNSYVLFGNDRSEVEKTPTDFISSDSQVVYKEVESDTDGRRLSDTYDLDSPEGLRRQAEQLRHLNRFHSTLSQPADLEEMLERILDCAFETLRPDQGVIFLRQSDGEFQRAAERATSPYAQEHFESRTLLNKVGNEGLAALVRGLSTDPDWTEADSMLDHGIRSVAASPIADSNGSLGMIALTSHETQSPFGDTELDLLVSLSSVAALRIRNMMLAEEAAREEARRELVERDLDLARKIQVALLPSKIPEIEGFELRGCSVPCRQVSGDYYQVIARKKGKEALLVIADVVGKGIGASLLTGSLEALAAGPIDVGRPPREICNRVNRRLHARTSTGRFAAMLLVSLDAETGVLTYANAGQSPGLLIQQNGETRRLTATGPPLGLFIETLYTEDSLEMAPGDLLVLYTDGITEAEDPEQNEFGIGRLEAICQEHRRLPLPEIARAIESDMQRFAAGTPFEDDRTMVMARRVD